MIHIPSDDLVVLCLGFDTFGGERKSEHKSQVGDRRRDRTACLEMADVSDEASVDLDVGGVTISGTVRFSLRYFMVETPLVRFLAGGRRVGSPAPRLLGGDGRTGSLGRGRMIRVAGVRVVRSPRYLRPGFRCPPPNSGTAYVASNLVPYWLKKSLDVLAFAGDDATAAVWAKSVSTASTLVSVGSTMIDTFCIGIGA